MSDAERHFVLEGLHLGVGAEIAACPLARVDQPRLPPDPRFSREKWEANNEFLQILQNGSTRYRLLGRPDYADERQVAQARRIQAAESHRDKNGFEEAKKCYEKVENAYALVRDPDLKRQYGRRLRKKAKHSAGLSAGKGGHARFGESFDESAWVLEDGDDVDLRKHVETDTYSDQDRVSRKATLPCVPPPSKAITEIQKNKLDGDIATWVMSRDEDAGEMGRLRTRDANARIKKENISSGFAAHTYTLVNDGIASLLHDFTSIKAMLRTGAVHLSHGLCQAIVINFDALRKRPENQWPDSLYTKLRGWKMEHFVQRSSK